MKCTKVKRLLAIALTTTLIFNGNVMLSAQTKEVISYSTQETRSKSDVIEISTEKDLKKICDNLTGNYKLKNNIKLSGKEWTSIRVILKEPLTVQAILSLIYIPLMDRVCLKLLE